MCNSQSSKAFELAAAYLKIKEVRTKNKIHVQCTFIMHNPIYYYRQEFFTGKYTTRKMHTKLHPGPEWHIFHILTSEDIDDVLSRPFGAHSR